MSGVQYQPEERGEAKTNAEYRLDNFDRRSNTDSNNLDPGESGGESSEEDESGETEETNQQDSQAHSQKKLVDGASARTDLES